MEAKRFDEIRSFYDKEVPDVVARLLSNPGFCDIMNALFPESRLAEQREVMRKATSIDTFQRQVIYPIVRNLADKTTSSLELSGFKYLDKSQSYTYISNHRDIILDSAFLDILLIEKGLDTFEIAIGDNLLSYPWIKDIVRLNRSFIVKRDLSVRNSLLHPWSCQHIFIIPCMKTINPYGSLNGKAEQKTPMTGRRRVC